MRKSLLALVTVALAFALIPVSSAEAYWRHRYYHHWHPYYHHYYYHPHYFYWGPRYYHHWHRHYWW